MKNYLQRKNENYDLFDAFDDFFRPVFSESQNTLKTNIKESEDSYSLEIEIPGYEKEQIKLALNDGYLTVSAEKKEENEGKYIRKEISSSCSRSYYVGDGITGEEIKAKYENGILFISLPKETPKKVNGQFIAIE